jgi:hypothetical protein
MGQKFQYTTVNNLLAKLHRDFRGSEINESDTIEWIGEALGFMRIASVQEEGVAFIEVKNYQCDIPKNLHFITQIARSNRKSICPSDIVDESKITIANGGENQTDLLPIDCHGNIIGDYEAAYYRPYFDLKYEYEGWNNSSVRVADFTPVRLSNHSFFNTLVCKEKNFKNIYFGCDDEYSIIGDQLRFSFQSGFIAVAYLRQKVDSDGYPMIPDDISCKTAIEYYVSWKMQDRLCFMHREGACQLALKSEQRWLKYVKQFKNKAKMPHGVDQHQNLLEMSRYLIPNFNRYYGFFGKLGKGESRPFRDPDNNNNYTR